VYDLVSPGETTELISQSVNQPLFVSDNETHKPS